MAMLDVLARLAPRFGIRLFAHGVDHGLRPEAGRELDLAASLASKCGVDFTRSAVTVAHGGNLQSRARSVRYQALQQRAAELGGAIIATAHHADDRAETVILRLLRGAGLLGLGVLAPRKGPLMRPLIRARRSDIHAHLARHEIDFATDPSNQNKHYLRVQVRLELLPMLTAMSPRIVDELCAIADEALGLREPGPADLEPDGAETVRGLGRRQRDATLRAIAASKVGFRLPLGNGLVLRLDEDDARRR